MKELNELVLPDEVRYTRDHEWAKWLDGEKVLVGITDYAQDRLGDIVFVDLPEIGATFEQGKECATLESVKAVAEVYIPMGGEVVAVNQALEDSPGLVNEAPYSDGWLLEVLCTNPAEWDGLMTRNAYLEMLKGLQE
jgi:glycine cleavage system H protein